MKPNNIVPFLLFIVSIIIFNTSFAQELAIKEGTYVLNEITYKVDSLNIYDRCVIYRNQRPQLKPNRSIVDGLPLDYIDLELTNYDVLVNKVRTLLGKTKCDALSRAGERILFTFIFDPNGRIIDITFAINANGILTLLDIAVLDKDLRESYTGTFKSDFNGHKHLYWIHYNCYIRF